MPGSNSGSKDAIIEMDAGKIMAIQNVLGDRRISRAVSIAIGNTNSAAAALPVGWVRNTFSYINATIIAYFPSPAAISII